MRPVAKTGLGWWLPMLTPLHKNVLLTGFLDVESRLKRMEALLVQGTRRYPLNEYVGDLSPTETKVVADYFARIRSTMQTSWRSTRFPSRRGRRSSPRALQRGMTLLDVALAELGPKRLQGYGSMHDAGRVEYASEEKNPGNYKHVTGIIVAVPSPRLRDGVVLVDTPGIGSLATGGSEETFAYLPRCDLSVVLIDAGSNLNDDNLSLLAPYEAGIPAQVLLSKADLLKPADRQRVLQYVGEQLRRGLNLELTVHPVSIVGQDAALLDAWFEREIEPLWERHRTLVKSRCIARLRACGNRSSPSSKRCRQAARDRSAQLRRGGVEDGGASAGRRRCGNRAYRSRPPQVVG